MYRRGKLPILLAGTALLAAASLACEDAQAPADDLSAIVVRVSVNHDTIRADETVHVTISATNPTDRRVSCRRGESCGPLLEFEVRSAGGTLVRAPVDDCVRYTPVPPVMDPTTWLEFGPGETRQSEFGWTPQRGTEAFTPGRYAVIGLLRVPGGPRSDPVWVEILPASGSSGPASRLPIGEVARG